ncbi:MAG: hypothetical protein WD844_09605 [Thermoleophilaceae bacterium]
MDDVDPTTEELRLSQLRREAEERRAADESGDDSGDSHQARASKAAYLREKLEQRARAERESGER